MELSQSNIIVTGASRGIGLALVEDLLAKGANVAGWSRTLPELQHERFLPLSVDVRDEEAVNAAFAQTTATFGQAIHGLVNNAGVGIFKAMEALSSEEWQLMFDVNVLGIFHCSKAVIPGMKERERGHIINIASTAGLEGIELATAYCGTKYAVKGISAAMYKELRRSRIKVSCVYPGSVNTDFFGNFPGIQANDTMMSPQEVAQTIAHLLAASDNFNTLNVEMRPVHVVYR